MHKKNRTKKVRRDSQRVRLLEARRLQRLASKGKDVFLPTPPMPSPIKTLKPCQNQIILELAWKTVALMQKNKMIQDKIVALQKETSEFIATVMAQPENHLHLEHLRLHGIGPATVTPARDAPGPDKPANCILNLTRPRLS